jgi:hypothetical protein
MKFTGDHGVFYQQKKRDVRKTSGELTQTEKMLILFSKTKN